MVKRKKTSGGKKEYPAYTYPGMHPIVYVSKNGKVFCADCASKKKSSIENEARIWEGPDIECDQCGNTIESAED